MVTIVTTAARSGSCNGGPDTEEILMNFLSIIRDRQLKKQRLSEAQRLMAKAYRGTPYTDAEHTNPTGEYELMYRGLQHNVKL